MLALVVRNGDSQRLLNQNPHFNRVSDDVDINVREAILCPRSLMVRLYISLWVILCSRNKKTTPEDLSPHSCPDSASFFFEELSLEEPI